MPVKKVSIIFGLMMGLGTLSCVIRTEHKIEAHVVVDIRYVKTQADDMYDFLSGDSDLADLDTEDAGEEHSSLLPELLRPSSLARLFSFSTPAHAASSGITDDQKKILIRMKARFADLLKYKGMACVGERNNAQLIYRACDACKKDAKLKAKVDKIIKDENADRKALYVSIAKAQGGGAADAPKIQKVWAEKFRKEAKKGHWIQMPASGKELEQFKKTPQGKKMKDAKPNEWRKVS